MILPTIHLNGNSAADLTDQYRKAHVAIGTAIEALRETEGHNGRNTYPQGQDAQIRAVAEHRERLRRLESVAEEVEALLIHCADARST